MGLSAILIATALSLTMLVAVSDLPSDDLSDLLPPPI